MKSLRSVCCVLVATLLLAFSMAACTRDKNNGSMGSSESSMAPESSTNRRETESQMPGTAESSKGLLDELGDDLSSDLDRMETE